MLTLWTIRPVSDYEILRRDGVYRTNPALVDEHRLSAYHWIASELAKRTQPLPHTSLPVWAWYHAHGANKPKPDLRQSGHLPKGEKGVRIEFTIPKEMVLLSNFDAWHSVLNDWCFALDDDEYEHYERLEQTLPPDEFQGIKEQTWQKIFDLSLIPDPTTYEIQAVFWELRLDWVKKVDFFTAR